MARGWESKSVEDQVQAADAARDARQPPHMTPEQRDKETRKQSLLLSRAQTIQRLNSTTNARYRAQLEQALKHLDEQLKSLQ